MDVVNCKRTSVHLGVLSSEDNTPNSVMYFAMLGLGQEAECRTQMVNNF